MFDVLVYSPAVRWAVRFAVPSEVRYWLTLLLFWPTVLLARLRSWLAPAWRRKWDRITPSVVLGVVPAFRSDVDALRSGEGGVAVVNCCREWHGHAGPSGLYAQKRLAVLHLPTIDWDVPRVDDLLAGAAFIHSHARSGASTYVHCKAGRGRSTCVVLAYLVLVEGLAPREAHDRIAARRPHVSKKWAAAEVRAVWELRQALDRARAAPAFLRAVAAAGDCAVPGVAAVVRGKILLVANN